MYLNAGYIDTLEGNIEDLNHSLIINCCGIYRLVSKNVMSTLRPNGRHDYQLIYISSGKAYFHFDDRTEIITAGHMILYKPHECQNYEYYLEDHPEVYWVHFSGNSCTQYLERMGFLENRKLYTGVHSDFIHIFTQMIQELQVKRPLFEEILCSYFQQMVFLTERYHLEGSQDSLKMQAEMRQAVQDFYARFSEEINIHTYATQHHMSVCWFIRCFKDYTGLSPLQYITSIRITKSKELLESSCYSINEIAALVGYENPLYFSRIFKKHTGFSPLQYRKSIQTQPV